MSTYLYIYGTLQIANLFLALVAAVMAISLFHISHQRSHLKPWKVLIIALLLFMALEVIGALRSFGIYTSPFLTHVITSAIIALLVVTLVMQIRIGEE
ncbi:hypothetical protein J4464_00345 [Candidatus Woesearchaeota archaeon]|nr:hypothetical protein [Candidatus Woesearchaeota archaeon]